MKTGKRFEIRVSYVLGFNLYDRAQRVGHALAAVLSEIAKVEGGPGRMSVEVIECTDVPEAPAPPRYIDPTAN